MRQFKSTPASLVARELGERLGRECRIRKLGGYLGRNEIFAVDHDAIVKVFHADGPSKCARELAAYDLLADVAGVPVARVLATGTFSDQEHWLLLSRLGGAPIEECEPEPGGVDRLYAEIGRIVATLHAVAISDEFPGLPRDYQRFRRRVLDEHRPDRDLLLAAAARMDELAPAQASAPRVFLHGDLCMRNVMIESPSAVEVSGVVDFERARIGDPMDDLATLAFKEFERRPGFESTFLAAYTKLRPLGEHAEQRLEYHLLGLLFEVVGWAWADDRDYHDRALAAMRRVIEGRS